MSFRSITIEPILARWPSLLQIDPVGSLLGKTREFWQQLTRRELNLPTDRRIIATGHQPTLWHPGILAKYAAVDAALRERGPRLASGVNIVVDQDVLAPAAFDVPLRRSDGTLASRQIDLGPPRRVDEVPVGFMPAFQPREIQVDSLGELPELAGSVQHIRAALAAEAHQSSAAAQVAAALSRLMQQCADLAPLSAITGSDMMRTTLARALLQAMADDPHRCAQAYNRAVAAHPRAHLSPLAIRDDYVELPLWRVRDDRTRVRAYDADLQSSRPAVIDHESSITLLPRALFMTAFIRLAVADLFVHGEGGAIYDRAMEQWIREWLGAEVAPMATATATVRLPLMRDGDLDLIARSGLAAARRRARLLEHDPEAADGEAGGWGVHHPGPRKQRLLREIDALPPRSHERRQSFFEMHRRLEAMRREHSATIEGARVELVRLQRLARDAEIALRRDWAFPLYPRQMLLDLTSRVRAAVGA